MLRTYLFKKKNMVKKETEDKGTSRDLTILPTDPLNSGHIVLASKTCQKSTINSL